MENYDLIVEKTVKDLFRSNELIQIKKYKLNKEKEISEKDLELKKLILEKYNVLIDSMIDIEEISKHLNQFQEIKNKVIYNLNNLNFNFLENLGKNSLNLDDQFLKDDFEQKEKNEIDFFEEFDKNYKILNKNEKNYEIIFENLLNIKNKILNVNNNNEEELNKLKTKYNFFIVDLFENILKNFLEKFNLISIENYINFIDNIYNNLILNNETISFLEFSEFYLKIIYDENITKIFKNFFEKLNFKFSLQILIKLIILKISQNIYELSKIDENNINLNINLIYNFFEILLTLINLIKNFCKENDEIINNNIKEFLFYIQKEIANNFKNFLIINIIKNNLNIPKIKINILINFWKKIFEYENNNNNNLLEYLNNLLNQNFYHFLFLNKCLEQITNISEQIFDFYFYENNFNFKIYFKNMNIKENDFYLIFDSIYKIKDEKLKNNLITLIEKKFNKFIDNLNEKIKIQNLDLDYFNIIIKILQNLTENNLIINEIKNKIDKISEIYFQINLEKIKNHLNQFFYLYLLYENKLLNFNDSNNENILTNSLNEIIIFISNFEIKEKKFQIQIFKFFYLIYEKVLNKTQTFNNKIINDLKFLKSIDDVNNYDNLFKIINNKFNIEIKDDDKNLFENLPKNIFILKENEKQIFENSKKNINLKTKENQFKKEIYIPNQKSNNLNIYLLNKSKINYKNKDFSQTTTSKILEHRIDESYLSLK